MVPAMGLLWFNSHLNYNSIFHILSYTVEQFLLNIDWCCQSLSSLLKTEILFLIWVCLFDSNFYFKSAIGSCYHFVEQNTVSWIFVSSTDTTDNSLVLYFWTTHLTLSFWLFKHVIFSTSLLLPYLLISNSWMLPSANTEYTAFEQWLKYTHTYEFVHTWTRTKLSGKKL